MDCVVFRERLYATQLYNIPLVKTRFALNIPASIETRPRSQTHTHSLHLS